MSDYDVLVIGSGNAGLCAAISAAEQGGKVLVIESAPESYVGGNSYFTGGIFRFPHNGIEDIRRVIPDLHPSEEEIMVVDPYTPDDFFEDIMRLGGYDNDPELVNLLVENARASVFWLRERGVRFNVQFGRQGFKDAQGRYHFPGGVVVGAVGGGKGLIEQELALARKLGVEIVYESTAVRLLVEAGRASGVVVRRQGREEVIHGRAVVLASGGFEANPEMRAKYLGPGWDRVSLRGTPYNTGLGITMALEIGAAPYGNWSSAHAVAWDLNAPKGGDRNVANLFSRHSYPFGVVVNRDGKRFLDEGYDVSSRTYAKYGGEILKQPGRVAFQIFDAKVTHLLREEYRTAQVTKVQANSLDELAARLEIRPESLRRTVEEFNAAVQEDVQFDPTKKDGRGTVGIEPPKSNWAQKIDTPPFVAFPVTCGITFTFGGLKVNQDAQVVALDGTPIPGLFAAGELVGGLFYDNYPSGSGLSSGTTFGRIAGRSAIVK